MERKLHSETHGEWLVIRLEPVIASVVMLFVLLNCPLTGYAVKPSDAGVLHGRVISQGELSVSEDKSAFDPKQAAQEYFAEGLKRQQKALIYERKQAKSNRTATKARYAKKAKSLHETAVAYFANAAEYDPEHMDAWSGLALSLLKAGGYDEAIRAYDVVLDGRPNNAQDVYYRGEAHLMLGHMDEMKKAYADLTRFAELNGDYWSLVDRYMEEMIAWASERKSSPGSLEPSRVEDFAGWATETAKIAAETYRWSLPMDTDAGT